MSWSCLPYDIEVLILSEVARLDPTFLDNHLHSCSECKMLDFGSHTDRFPWRPILYRPENHVDLKREWRSVLGPFSVCRESDLAVWIKELLKKLA
jgi:hypothetical protein